MKFSGRTLFNNTPTEIVLSDGRVQTIREVDSGNGNT